jgi:hypothetical protein
MQYNNLIKTFRFELKRLLPIFWAIGLKKDKSELITLTVSVFSTIFDNFAEISYKIHKLLKD